MGVKKGKKIRIGRYMKMKNKEKYAKEIIEIAKYGQRVAIDRNGKIRSCLGLDCKDCIIHEDRRGKCAIKRQEWFESEARKRQEEAINEEIEKVKREYGRQYNSGKVYNITKRRQWYMR